MFNDPNEFNLQANSDIQSQRFSYASKSSLEKATGGSPIKRNNDPVTAENSTNYNFFSITQGNQNESNVVLEALKIHKFNPVI